MSTIINGTSSAITFPDSTVQNSAGLVAGGTIATGTVTTLTTTTISDGTNSTSSTNCIQGSAKAWVNFDSSSATSCAVRSSYNVSSVTYNGTGDYTINYTTALANTNYVVNITGSNSTTVSVPIGFTRFYTTAPTTTASRIGLANDGGVNINTIWILATIHSL